MELEQIESLYKTFDIEYRVNYGCQYNVMLYNQYRNKENFKITCIYDGSYDEEERRKTPLLLDNRYPDLCKRCEYLYIKGITPNIDNYMEDLYRITPYVGDLARQEVMYVEKHKEHSPNYYKVQEIFKP